MKEGEIVTSDNLREEWKRVLSTYDTLIDNQHKLRPIRFIIRHIIERGYDSMLFPGTSLYSLLISIPSDNKVNFNKTLKITFDEQTETLKFTFSDWTGVDRQTMDAKKLIKWIYFQLKLELIADGDLAFLCSQCAVSFCK